MEFYVSWGGGGERVYQHAGASGVGSDLRENGVSSFKCNDFCMCCRLCTLAVLSCYALYKPRTTGWLFVAEVRGDSQVGQNVQPRGQRCSNAELIKTGEECQGGIHRCCCLFNAAMSVNHVRLLRMVQ